MKKKHFYKIGELTKKLSITSRTIRYYDQMGLLPNVKRSQGKVRLFDEEDVKLLKRIRQLQGEFGMQLEDIRDKLIGEASPGEKQVAVVTDSSAAIPKETIQRYGIQVIPIEVVLGERRIRDDGSMANADLWKLSEELGCMPQTLPISIDVLEREYRLLAEAGVRQIYSVHVSSQLSETVVNAIEAAKRVANLVKVRVVDSKSAAGGLGLLAEFVAEAVHTGQNESVIDRLIAQNQPLLFQQMVVNSLKHLLGVVITDPTKMSRMLERILDFKPVLGLSSTTGALEIIEWFRDKSSAMDYIINDMRKEVAYRGRYIGRVRIVYNYMYGESIELINKVKSEFSTAEVDMVEGGVALSAYVGPESIGVSIA